METAEHYKEKQQSRLAAFKVNSPDPSGNKITRVFGRGDEYVVYEIESRDLADSIKVNIDTTTEEDDSGIIKRYNQIRIKFVETKAFLYKAVDKSAIKSVIAQILIHGMLEDPATANQEFESLKERIDTEYSEQFSNKMRLLFSSLLLTLCAIGLSIWTYYGHLYQEHTHIRYLIYVCCAGSVGGFFSISIGMRKLVCEKEVKNYLYIAYGLERIVIAILAATIVYFIIRTELFFGNINTLAQPLVGYIVLGFVAGFSETLIPNLLTKIENDHK